VRVMATKRGAVPPYPTLSHQGRGGETAATQSLFGKGVTVKTYAIVAAEPKTVPAGDQEKQPPCSYHSLILMGGIFVVFYFLLIRPQQKRRKQEEQRKKDMLDNLQKNDQVMTVGGIHGIVAKVGEDEITLKVDEKSDTRIRVSRDAISRVVGDEDEEGGEGESK